uniref:SBP-type domain-containing protein n=1 Tax=Mantoniella antarctica TaxID=81844 RepID=A0A7S0X4U0_9CHLO|mmetsp:Transcript_17029/g.42043  ORF Transcript_17029/g.42043 Transcript_17029/m.42043 type:complete len:998 (+) Transcript_17029:240-3233(+)
MNQMFAAVRKTFGHRNEDTSAVSGIGGRLFRTTTPDVNEKHAPLLAAELPWEETVSDEVFFEALLSFHGNDGGDRGNATQTTPSQALHTGAPEAAVATQQWRQEEWDLDNRSLAVVDLLSTASAAAASVGSRAPGNEADLGSEVRDPEEPGISRREAMRRLRIQRAAEKETKNLAVRDELRRKGAKTCDVVGCVEPKMEGSKRICTIHKGALELFLENKTGPHRWCLYCHTCHPVSSFGEGSRTICIVKHNLRKRRIDQRKIMQRDDAAKEVTVGIAPFEESTCHKRRIVHREDSETSRTMPFVESTDAGESSWDEVAVHDKSGTRGDVIWTGIDGQIGHVKDVDFGSYLDSYRCEVLNVKVDMNPDVLVHQDTLLCDAIKSLHYDYYSGSSHSDDPFGYATLPSRVGTPAVAGMMPGCTLMTVTSMTLKAESSDSLRNRVSRLIASTGGTGILQDERWGVMMAASGVDEDKVDEVRCAAADGNRIIAEHRGEPWPSMVRTPLCVVANDIVTLDLSAVAQPFVVRWLGDGVNTKITATATGESTPLMMSFRVPPTECCGILSVQALVHGQCMGTAFQHILVLPNDGSESTAIARELNNSRDTVSAADICVEGSKAAVIMSRRMRLYRNVTTDLAWLLSAHESGAAYENETVIARAIKIASGLQLVYNLEYGFPVLEARLQVIELDLLEYCEENRNETTNETNGVTDSPWMVSCFVPDGNRSLFSFDSGGGSGGGGGGSDDDGEEDILLREEIFRGVLGTQRATPMTDMGVMLVWMTVACVFLLQSCGWNALLVPGKFFSALRPTGFLDGSILTRSFAGLAGPLITVYACYLVRRDVHTWTSRREGLFMMFRITSTMFALNLNGYLQRLDPSTKDALMDKTIRIARFFVIRFLRMIMSTVIAPLRFERHALIEMMRAPIMVVNAAVHSSLNMRETVAAAVVVLVFYAAEVLYLWKSERDFRRRAKIDVMHSSHREENPTPPRTRAPSLSTVPRHPKRD